MEQKDSRRRVIRALSFLTQFGLSVAAPPVLCVLFAVWLSDRYGLGEWVIITALAVGMISGGCSFYKFIRYFMHINRDKPEEGGGHDEN